jgi:hypothetical protein
MWRPVDLDRTNVSEEYGPSIFRVERICELGTTLADQQTAEFFHPADGGDMFLGNVSPNITYIAPYSRRWYSSASLKIEVIRDFSLVALQ